MIEPRAPAHDNDAAAAADHGEGRALYTFYLVLAIAFVGYLVIGRDHWFATDEWAFLIDRDAGDLGDLLRPHVVHWSTIPILVMRGVWQIFGLRSYLPYQVVIIGLHLTTALLLRAVMRRARVSPWMATLVASVFVLFGRGFANIYWAVQIGFVSALVLGLAHLLLADHEGPLSGRDWWGLLVGATGLMAAGVSLSMVAVVGLAMLVRRGWRIAAFHTIPLAGLYGLWWVAEGRTGNTQHAAVALGPIAEFIAKGFVVTFIGLGQIPLVSILLVGMLSVGLAVAWRQAPGQLVPDRLVLPLALFVGSGIFLVITGIGRAVDFGPNFALKSRYLHVVATMLAPALAVAADALVRRWRRVTPVVIALLLIGVPGNLALAANREHRGNEALVRALFAADATNAPADAVPTWVEPEATGRMTVGWMREVIAGNRAPSAGQPSPRMRATATLAMSARPAPDPPALRCRAIDTATRQQFEAGDHVATRGDARLWLVTGDGARSRDIPTTSIDGQALEILAGPLTLGFAPVPGDNAEVCR